MNIEFHMLGKSWLSYLIPTASFLYSSLCGYWDLPSFLTAEDFNCDVEPDGKIVIKGVTTTGEKIVCKNSQIFQMQTQNLCPPGHFSISPAARSSGPPTIFWFFRSWWDFGRYCEEKVTKEVFNFWWAACTNLV